MTRKSARDQIIRKREDYLEAPGMSKGKAPLRLPRKAVKGEAVAVAANQHALEQSATKTAMKTHGLFNGYTDKLERWMSSSEAAFSEGQDGFFNELALELFRLQFEHVPACRRYWQYRGTDPGAVRSWKEIPALPIAAFKEVDVSGIPADMRRVVFHSSGTTGQQLSRHYHSVESLALYERSLWPWFAKHLLTSPDQPCPVMILTPSPENAPNSSLVYMFDTVRRRMGLGQEVFYGRCDETGWHVEMERAWQALCRVSDGGQPLMLLGTAFSFVHLIDHLMERGTRLLLPPGSRILETGGYKGRSRTLSKEDLHGHLSEWLGIRREWIVTEYGMSELSSQAYDSQAGATSAARVFRFPPWARVLVKSPETGLESAEGEAGIISIVDLANVYSALAIETGDLGVPRSVGIDLVGRVGMAERRGCSLMAS